MLWTLAATAMVVATSAAEEWWNCDQLAGGLWLATAVLTSAGLVCPARLRARVVAGGLVGSAAAQLWFHDATLRTAVAPVAARAVEVITVIALCDRWLAPGPSIRRTRHAQTFFGVALTAGVLGATVAALDDAALIRDGRLASWWQWLLAATIGQLVATPVVLTRHARFITPARGRWLAELVLTVVELAALMMLALVVDAPLLFTIVPLVMWLAIRFGPRLTAPLCVVIAVAVTAASTSGSGPFATPDLVRSVDMQLFSMSVALSSLIAGGHALRARRDHSRLAGILAAIPDIVLVRDVRGDVVDAWVPQGHRDGIESLAPGISDSPPIVDDEPPPVEQPTLVTTADGRTFERRAATVREHRTVEFYRDVTEERAARKELRRRQESIDDARTAEQARIAKAIHDSPLQLLAAAKIRIETAAADVADASTAALLASATDLIAQSIGELRGQLSALTPPDVAAGAVVPALEQVARQVLEPHVDISTLQATHRLRPDVATVLFQAGREALSNTAKHARASAVRLELVETAGTAVLTVTDDGVGPTTTSDDRGHIGLSLLRERVVGVGGRVDLVQRPGAGTALVVTVPTGCEQP